VAAGPGEAEVGEVTGRVIHACKLCDSDCPEWDFARWVVRCGVCRAEVPLPECELTSGEVLSIWNDAQEAP
jgi:hypothetical protein